MKTLQPLILDSKQLDTLRLINGLPDYIFTSADEWPFIEFPYMYFADSNSI